MIEENGGSMEIKKESKYAVGFDLGGTSLKYGYGNSHSGLLYFNTIDHKEKSLDGLIDTFRKAYADLKNNKPDCFKSLGLATPGIVDSKRNLVLGSTPNLPFLKNINLVEILYNITSLPIFIENDANLMTLAEAQDCDTNSALGITIGTGLGTGFVINNDCSHDSGQHRHSKTIYKGENDMAMESGHMIIFPQGRPCLCGKNGCLEAYTSAESIKKIIYERFPEHTGLSIKEILDHKSLRVKSAICELIDILALGVANISMILNPGTIFIGGGVAEIESFDFGYLKNKIYIYLSEDYKYTKIKRALYGNRAGVLGAIIFSENNETKT